MPRGDSLEAGEREHVPRRNPTCVLQLIQLTPNRRVRGRDNGVVHRGEEDADGHGYHLQRA